MYMIYTIYIIIILLTSSSPFFIIFDMKENISFRIDSEIRKVLEKLANDEFRPLSFQVEKIILEWLRDKKLLPKDYRGGGKKT